MRKITGIRFGSILAASAGMSIRYAVVLLAGLCLTACGSSTPAPSPTPTPTPSPSTSVSMVNGAFGRTTNAYSPSPVTVAVGSVVTFTNNDVAPHDARADNGRFATPILQPGGSANVTLSTAEIGRAHV